MGDLPGVGGQAGSFPQPCSHCPAPGGTSPLKDGPFRRPRPLPHPQKVPESGLEGVALSWGHRCRRGRGEAASFLRRARRPRPPRFASAPLPAAGSLGPSKLTRTSKLRFICPPSPGRE